MTAPDLIHRTTKTTCPYCGVGCGVLATPDGAGGAAITGDPDHPANFGRLCSKGSALGETLGLDTRLLHPMVRNGQGYKSVAWDEALSRVSTGLTRIIDRHGPGAVAFYLSGQLLTEDYYVANKLMKGFIGSANVDTNSRLCMASSVAGHMRAFGSDTVPGCYEDLDQADLIVLVGSNAAWCHPILYQRMMKNRAERGAKIVVIDPRRTDTAEDIDLFLGVKPGSDTALFSGLLVHLADHGALDNIFITAHTAGFDAALARARELAPSVVATAAATGLAVADVAAFFALFRDTPRAVTCYSQGVNQSAQGTDKVNAIVNCHLATGRVGKPGAGPFSLTGQPNAMGGREVGGMANQLAAHMRFTPPDIDLVRRFWHAPHIATHEGHKAVQMFDAIARGEIRALWVMGTNPAVSLPDAGAAREAMSRLELFVVSENVRATDTVNCGAHVLLPAQAWGEKSGTVTNSERRVSRQRAFLQPAGNAKPDWWIMSEVAKRMGFGEAFGYQSAADIFREHAALSAFENDGKRDFDLGGLAEIADESYDTMKPVTWPVRRGATTGSGRLFGDGRFFTPDRKARFVAPEAPALRTATTPERPLRLNTGRVRDQWHTMTRSGLSPRLGQHISEPYIEVHPEDAKAAGIEEGGYARVETAFGRCLLKVRISSGQQRGSIFAPIHWNDQTASCARVGSLAAPFTDPYSGQPEMKATPASLEAVQLRQRGFVLAREAIDLPQGAVWARVAVEQGVGYKVAADEGASLWCDWLRKHQGDCDLIEYSDAANDSYRAALLRDGRIELCVFIATGPAALSWDAVAELFAAPQLDDQQRRMLLSGKSAAGGSDGPVVCACFGVGRNKIAAALAAGEACSVAEIGATLRAGTNCGSCIPELKRMVAAQAATAKDMRAAE